MSQRNLSSAPLVWGLLGARHGDNQQVRALAAALGWPVELKQLHMNRLFMLPNALLGAGLLSLKAESRRQLQVEHWPDIVIGVGRRSVPIARWIKARSGGRTRLVQIGRPRASLDLFDLVVTTPQYGLAERGNVLHNLMPLGSARDGAELGPWPERWADLPRPWIGVLLGGSRWPLALDERAGHQLGRQTRELAGRINAGTLLAIGGPRTDTGALQGFATAAGAGTQVFGFKRGQENPYQAVLALCDQFVVTGDSVSMVAEAAGTGKPVHIFDLPRRRGAGAVAALGRIPGALLKPLISAGLFSTPRDVGRFLTRLYQAGLAQPLGKPVLKGAAAPGEAVPGSGQTADMIDEMAQTAARVRALIG